MSDCLSATRPPFVPSRHYCDEVMAKCRCSTNLIQATAMSSCSCLWAATLPRCTCISTIFCRLTTCPQTLCRLLSCCFGFASLQISWHVSCGECKESDFGFHTHTHTLHCIAALDESWLVSFIRSLPTYSVEHHGGRVTHKIFLGGRILLFFIILARI